MHFEAPNGATTACGVALRDGVEVAYDLPEVECGECLAALKAITFPLSRERIERLVTVLQEAQLMALKAGDYNAEAEAIVEKLSEAFRVLDDVRGIIR
jgi:hypothetical protein